MTPAQAFSTKALLLESLKIQRSLVQFAASISQALSINTATVIEAIENESANWDGTALKEWMQRESRLFAAMSSVLKAKEDLEKGSVENLR